MTTHEHGELIRSVLTGHLILDSSSYKCYIYNFQNTNGDKLTPAAALKPSWMRRWERSSSSIDKLHIGPISIRNSYPFKRTAKAPAKEKLLTKFSSKTAKARSVKAVTKLIDMAEKPLPTTFEAGSISPPNHPLVSLNHGENDNGAVVVEQHDPMAAFREFLHLTSEDSVRALLRDTKFLGQARNTMLSRLSSTSMQIDGAARDAFKRWTLEMALVSYGLMVNPDHRDSAQRRCPHWKQTIQMTLEHLDELYSRCQQHWPHLQYIVNKHIVMYQHLCVQAQDGTSCVDTSSETEQHVQKDLDIDFDKLLADPVFDYDDELSTIDPDDELSTIGPDTWDELAKAVGLG
eukprot:TRINITY_DN4628_c0_g1_i1.p1 TRINITY_DN4628_c0_g1~~TRINITY_DN4628_c0_g1_i1.p1  ORF type:complete len:347 (+),score=59.65 TRINITY_DN4628_c0_g1_i1:505-1545(+)